MKKSDDAGKTAETDAFSEFTTNTAETVKTEASELILFFEPEYQA